MWESPVRDFQFPLEEDSSPIKKLKQELSIAPCCIFNETDVLWGSESCTVPQISVRQLELVGVLLRAASHQLSFKINPSSPRAL